MAVFLPIELPLKDTQFSDNDIIITQEDGSQEVKKITIDTVNKSLTFLKLKDTFSSFEDGKYLKSTADSVILTDVQWSEIQDTPITISGYGITDAYTKTEVDDALATKANINDVYTKTEVDDALATKANIDDVYSKTEVDDKLEQYTFINSDYTNDKNNNFIFADTSANVITVTLQAEPILGNKVTIHDNTGSFATNNLTVNGNGKNINGNATLVLSEDNSTTRLIYNGNEWRII